ncbi:hypothetical protein LXL04_024562 [Taraxacum kok-saghyz]
MNILSSTLCPGMHGWCEIGRERSDSKKEVNCQKREPPPEVVVDGGMAGCAKCYVMAGCANYYVIAGCGKGYLHVNIFIYFSLPLRMLGQELALCQTLGVQHRLSQILSKLITQDILMFLRNNQINHIKQSHLSEDTERVVRDGVKVTRAFQSRRNKRDGGFHRLKEAGAKIRKKDWGNRGLRTQQNSSKEINRSEITTQINTYRRDEVDQVPMVIEIRLFLLYVEEAWATYATAKPPPSVNRVCKTTKLSLSRFKPKPFRIAPYADTHAHTDSCARLLRFMMP